MDLVKDAQNLAFRFQQGETFRRYVLGRLQLVVPGAALIVVTSIACSAGTVVFLAGSSSWLLLLAMLAIPVVLLGSLFVLVYVFFAWLENRALARLRGGLDRRLGPLPRVPWALATLVLFVPLAMLLRVAPQAALLLVALLAVFPVVYARLDR